MLSIAGQTAGPIGLTFFVDTHRCFRLKNSKYCFKNKIFKFFLILYDKKLKSLH